MTRPFFAAAHANGGFVGDSWHGTKEDALRQAKREFGVAIDDPEAAV